MAWNRYSSKYNSSFFFLIKIFKISSLNTFGSNRNNGQSFTIYMHAFDKHNNNGTIYNTEGERK